jgi:hypothetical protein
MERIFSPSHEKGLPFEKERRGGFSACELSGASKEARSSFSRGGEGEARREALEPLEEAFEKLLFEHALRLEGFESEEKEERFELLESERTSHEHAPMAEKRAKPPPESSCQSA